MPADVEAQEAVAPPADAPASRAAAAAEGDDAGYSDGVLSGGRDVSGSRDVIGDGEAHADHERVRRENDAKTGAETEFEDSSANGDVRSETEVDLFNVKASSSFSGSNTASCPSSSGSR